MLIPTVVLPVHTKATFPVTSLRFNGLCFLHSVVILTWVTECHSFLCDFLLAEEGEHCFKYLLSI